MWVVEDQEGKHLVEILDCIQERRKCNFIIVTCRLCNISERCIVIKYSLTFYSCVYQVNVTNGNLK
jgi:hypothetical protein